MVLNLTTEEYEFLVEFLSDAEKSMSHSVTEADAMVDIAKALMDLVAMRGKDGFTESNKMYMKLVKEVEILKTKTMNLTALLNNIAPERELKELI